MSGWRNNGSKNRTHGQVEATPRIDSYEVGAAEGLGCLFGYAGKDMLLVLDCDHYTIYGPVIDREIVKVWHPKERWSQNLELSRKENGFGGSQAFFLCPACGRRVRYLYLTWKTFRCRKCSKLNYQSQQEIRSNSMYYYHKGVALVEKHLDTWPRVRPDGFTFCNWVPDRPRYMHETTYRRYLVRFLRYRRQHEARQLEDLRKLIGFSLGAGALREIDRLQYED